jgi:uncharacterized OB-fold protein
MPNVLGGFTADEIQFLRDQSLSKDDVFEGPGLTGDERAAEAKRLNKPLIIGTPCGKAGHRLLTRSHHCAQCNTAVLRYQARHTEKSAVYVAYSASNNLTKIGVSNEIAIRESKINFEGYAGATDWEVLFSIVVDEAGRVETAAQVHLARYLSKKIYQTSKEAFSCGPLRAVNAVVDKIAEFGLAHGSPNINSKLNKIPL